MRRLRGAAQGLTWTLIGHSERRTKYGETDADVAEKAFAMDFGDFR